MEERIEFLTNAWDLLGDEFGELNNLKRELSLIRKSAEALRLFRSKCNWAMYGGKSSKFFLNLEKNKFQDKVISQIFDKYN